MGGPGCRLPVSVQGKGGLCNARFVRVDASPPKLNIASAALPCIERHNTLEHPRGNSARLPRPRFTCIPKLLGHPWVLTLPNSCPSTFLFAANSAGVPVQDHQSHQRRQLWYTAPHRHHGPGDRQGGSAQVQPLGMRQLGLLARKGWLGSTIQGYHIGAECGGTYVPHPPWQQQGTQCVCWQAAAQPRGERVGLAVAAGGQWQQVVRHEKLGRTVMYSGPSGPVFFLLCCEPPCIQPKRLKLISYGACCCIFWACSAMQPHMCFASIFV